MNKSNHFRYETGPIAELGSMPLERNEPCRNICMVIRSRRAGGSHWYLHELCFRAGNKWRPLSVFFNTCFALIGIATCLFILKYSDQLNVFGKNKSKE